MDAPIIEAPPPAAGGTQVAMYTNSAITQSPEDSTWSVLPNDLDMHTRSGKSIEHAQIQPPQSALTLTTSLIVKLKVDLTRFNFKKRPAPDYDSDASVIRVAKKPRAASMHLPDVQQVAGATAADATYTGMVRSQSAPQTPAPGANALFLEFQGGMYARERNPRRGATKAFGETVATPKPARQTRTTARQAKTPAAARARTLPSPATSTEIQTPAQKTKQAAGTKRRRTAQAYKDGPTKRQAVRKLTPAASSQTNEMRTRQTAEIDQIDHLPTPPADNSEVEAFLHTKKIEEKNGNGESRPARDIEFDERYVEEMQKVLSTVLENAPTNMHKKQSGRIYNLLALSKVADEKEALFLSTAEAEAQLATGTFFNGPIITVNQQALPLETPKQFLDEHYDDNAKIFIQDSSAGIGNTATSVRGVKMGAVKERFQSTVQDYPWNALELATHQDDGLRPMFLNTEDCRLLTKLKIPGAADEARRRTYEAGFKEVEKWALLAQAGALTEPHQDSHGYSTFITLNTGCIGFGWLSHPTAEEREAWRKDPMNFIGGNWRYVVLKPGQTVYFPAGTVHHVFRLPAAGDSLAYGGHVLRCSNLAHWVRTILEEHENPNITNEDLTDSSTGYLNRVETFVTQAKKNGSAAKWGGVKAINEFLRLKKVFESKGKPGKGKGGTGKRAASSEPAERNAPKTPKAPGRPARKRKQT